MHAPVDNPSKNTVGTCEECGDASAFLMPLHGARGGPLRCPLCIGKWNGKQGRRRRLGRIVIRAMRAYAEAGGTNKDIDKLWRYASIRAVEAIFGPIVATLGLGDLDALGYLANTADTNNETIELTSELLADTLKLTHPDHHPPEREQLARRTTQGLLALQPFVFPAPPRPEIKPPEARNESVKQTDKFERAVTNKPAYPCADCRDTTPYFYCDACKDEWRKRQEEKRKQQAAKQRKWYAQRKARLLYWKSIRPCAVCGTKFEGKRKDARFCSDACRQRAHRESVTAKSSSPGGILISRDNAVEARQ